MNEQAPAVKDYDQLTEADIASIAALSATEPEPGLQVLPASGPHADDCPHELVHDHAVTDDEGNRWEGRACAQCESWITTPAIVTGEQLTDRMQLGLLTGEDGSWSLQDKFGNVVAIGPALSRQLIMDIMAKATGDKGRTVPMQKPEAQPQNRQQRRQAEREGKKLDSAPAQHIIVPGKVRGKDY